MSLDEKKKIRAVMVVEVLGRPPEYLTETLENIIKAISEEKGVVVAEKSLIAPAPIKERPDFYSSFAEIEVETEEILSLAVLMFKYMPAHIEILSPQNFNLSNSGFNDLFNELTRRLHGYEEIARILQSEKMILENQLKTLLGEKEDEERESRKEPKAEKIKKPRKPRTKKAITHRLREALNEGEKAEKEGEIEEKEEKIVEKIEKEIEEEIEKAEKENGN